jgi:hypothetical protein
MDISIAGGSGMDSAVDNVNRATVVLVFMSNRLKNSPVCRTGYFGSFGLLKLSCVEF